MLIGITRHTAQKKYNTFHFSRCFTWSTTRLWNNLPNEVVLAVKQDHFGALPKNIFV